MHWTRFALEDLTEKQKDTLDCHRLHKTRYSYTGCQRTSTELVLPFANLDWLKVKREVLPPREAYTSIKYFTQRSPGDQLWERATLYHIIGSVDFYAATTYCDKYTTDLLEAEEKWPKPIIHYLYTVSNYEVEADSQFLVSRIAYEQRREKRERRRIQSELFDDDSDIPSIPEEEIDINEEESDTKPHAIDINPNVPDINEGETGSNSGLSDIAVSIQDDPKVKQRVAYLTFSDDSETESTDYLSDITVGYSEDDLTDSEDTQYCQVYATKRIKLEEGTYI